MNNGWQWMMFTLLLFCQQAWASAEQCNDIRTDSRFNVAYQIHNAQLKETIYATKKNDTRPLALWSNDASISPIISDTEMVAGGDYYIWLKYEQLGNKQGRLTYYLYESGSVPVVWRAVTTVFADLSPIKSVPIKVDGVAVEGMSCTIDDSAPDLPVSTDVCELFPGPVQTWVGNQNHLFTSDAGTQISNTKNNRVGFDNSIVEKLYDPDFRPEGSVDGLCDGIQCALGGMMAEKKTLNWNVPGTDIAKDHVVMADETAIPGRYYMAERFNFGLSVEPTGNLTFPSGEYWIDRADIRGEITVNGEVILHVLDLFRISNAGVVNTTSPSDNLTIYAYNNGDECPLPLNYPHYQPQVNTKYSVNISSSGLFNGRIYSQGPVVLSNQSSLIGAVTACQLQMSNSARIVGNSQCFQPPETNYQLIVSPSRALSLMCERQLVEFQVLDKTGALATGFQGSIDVTTNLTVSGQASWYEQASDGTGQDVSQSQRFAVVNGITRLWLKSEVIETIQVSGRLVSDGYPTANGQYSFVPFRLQLQDQALKMVAGKPESVAVSAMSCDASQSTPEVAKDYSGDRLLNMSTAYTLPDNGTKAIELKDKAGDWQTSRVTLTFAEGVASTFLRYLDAGQAQLKLVDPNCTKSGGCSIRGDGQPLDDLALGDWTQLEGTQTVWARPYTFALCGITASNGKTDFSGTASSGPGFSAAGESFSAILKPVIWTDEMAAPVQDLSGDGRHDVETTVYARADWCRVATTPNYYSVASVSAPFALSIPAKPASPDEPDAAGGILGGTLSGTFTAAQAAQGLTLSHLNWSEVGSVWLQADADYLGMTVDQGVGEIGRFYPHHFVIKDSLVLDANGDSFTYMEQPFSVEATIEAQNKQSGATQNYGNFAGQYQEAVLLRAVNDDASGSAANELTERLSEHTVYQSWSKAFQEIRADSITFLRVVSSVSPRVTLPDGPYPVSLGLVVRDRTDCGSNGCTDFQTKSQEIRVLDGATPERAAALSGDIHARYGRMRLEDSVGREGENVNMPVILEYWAQGQFVTNGDDSFSRFDGQHAFRQGLTNPESPAITVSGGEKTVVSGSSQSGDLYATGTAVREQVRFWQKLVSDIPAPIAGENEIKDSAAGTQVGAVPQRWLLYDWRGLGDENPSAVVTFGLYRGNDRIIYRGEMNINQALNE
ncbi:polymer-forming cytoskeletal protein [Photobacterium sp. CCB-ST2H9]|uniref:polymer-forming cytoskeletal protein n=1 Tax=Photobacterium sp. CCB-ST2H9 TaxID=2912855 RepID=UPI0020055FB5|nr:polymer-forming cytoskeletal protein [Photobacterium sp. CCB-ST2H9]UTM57648.1 polymer-forming cytoskeletal protein [Photobacterium sp. CCB-ST2H9]